MAQGGRDGSPRRRQGTHTKSGNQNHVSQSQGGDRRSGETAWLSLAGVHWDRADWGALCRLGAGQERESAQTGAGLFSRSSLPADMGQALTKALFTDANVTSKMQNLRMPQRLKPPSPQRGPHFHLQGNLAEASAHWMNERTKRLEVDIAEREDFGHRRQNLEYTVRDVGRDQETQMERETLTSQGGD